MHILDLLDFDRNDHELESVAIEPQISSSVSFSSSSPRPQFGHFTPVWSHKRRLGRPLGAKNISDRLTRTYTPTEYT